MRLALKAPLHRKWWKRGPILQLPFLSFLGLRFYSPTLVREDILESALLASNAQVTKIVHAGMRLLDGNGRVEYMLDSGGRKGGSFVSYDWRETRELRDQFIRAVYDLRDPNTGWAVGNAIMQRMGLDPENVEDEGRYFEIAHYFDEFGYIGGEASGFRIVSLSDLGIKYVEVESDLRREEEQEEGRA
jgi:hypothetical protein